MKILHVITSLQPGGAEKLMVDLIPRLRDVGNEVELAIFDGRITPFYEKLQEKGITIHRFMPKGGNVYNPVNIWKLLLLICKGRYDIVHTHNTAPQLFAAICSVLCSVVLVTTEHNTTNRRRDWKWYAPIDRWMYSRYKRVISISEKTQESLVSYLPMLKTPHVVVCNGISLEDYANAEPNRDMLDNYHDKFRITMVACFRCQKDHPTAIRSFSHLPENFNLFLVGDGVERAKCEHLVKQLNLEERVHFLGTRQDVASILKASHVCLISSHWEGFGLAAVEGMAAGCPVIASDVPGVAEVVRGAGLLFKQGDPQDLASNIQTIATEENLYKDVREKCAERALEYSIEKMVKGYTDVYDNICQSQS